MKANTTYISVGSNMGQKLQNCMDGIAALARGGESVLTGRSQFYRTEPVDYIDQDWFVNAVVRIETALDPFALLERLQDIQRSQGRQPGGIRFGPRMLDLDIIFYDRQVLRSETLTLPHPRMHKRRFVLKPMCDIDPQFVHPVLNRSMQALLDRIDPRGQRLQRC